MGYIDRFYVKHNNMPTLSESGLRAFKVNIYEKIKPNTTAAILDLIYHEREEKIIDRSLVKNIVQLYEQMGIGGLDTYSTDLEIQFLEASEEYYSRKREEWITKSTP